MRVDGGGGPVGRGAGGGGKSSRRSTELDFEYFINLCRSETYATWVSGYEGVMLAYGESNEFNEGEYAMFVEGWMAFVEDRMKRVGATGRNMEKKEEEREE